MPASKYGNEPRFLQETISKIAYNTEYTTSYTGEQAPFHNVRVPTRLRTTAWISPQKPGSSRVIQPPYQKRRTDATIINLQGLQPRLTTRAKSALQRPTSDVFERQSSHSRRPTSSVSVSSKSDRPKAEDIPRRPSSLVARRPQSLSSRFPMDYCSNDKQCFFHPANEWRRNFFVISPDWVSEHKNYFIRKNTLFG